MTTKLEDIVNATLSTATNWKQFIAGFVSALLATWVF